MISVFDCSLPLFTCNHCEKFSTDHSLWHQMMFSCLYLGSQGWFFLFPSSILVLQPNNSTNIHVQHDLPLDLWLSQSFMKLTTENNRWTKETLSWFVMPGNMDAMTQSNHGVTMVKPIPINTVHLSQPYFIDHAKYRTTMRILTLLIEVKLFKPIYKW